MIVTHFYTKGHPEANGREPMAGEHEYTLTFPLQNGDELKVHCGDQDLASFSDMIGRLIIDTQEESK